MYGKTRRTVMPKKRTASVSPRPQRFFVKELGGETPPSFEVMERLYGLASDLFSLRPWRVLDEDNLIVVPDSVSGELCYCSIMGALGEVFSMHTYIGAEGLRQFRRMEAQEIANPAEFFAFTHCLYVEFVPRAELRRQDRELLAALGHPQGRGLASPIFRTMRPGFLPWFVNEDEARTLTECIHGVIMICAAVASHGNMKFWERADTYPMAIRTEGAEAQYHVEMFQSVLPPEPPLAPARLDGETLSALRRQDYPVRGVIELDLTYGGAAIGKKGERSSCAAFAMAVDAENGMILGPDVADCSIPAGDSMAKAFVKAIQSSRVLPREVRVRSQKFKDSLAPLMDSLGVAIRVAGKLPASDEARSYMLQFFRGEFAGG
jgi:hypothetical protein